MKRRRRAGREEGGCSVKTRGLTQRAVQKWRPNSKRLSDTGARTICMERDKSYSFIACELLLSFHGDARVQSHFHYFFFIIEIGSTRRKKRSHLTVRTESVSSVSGPGDGWRLACPPLSFSLLNRHNDVDDIIFNEFTLACPYTQMAGINNRRIKK